jgi:putative ABC transport system permease protein
LFVALVAAGLALFGIYGVVGYSVTRRTREFGIRAALGASRTQIMGLVLRNGARPLLAGVAFGLVCAVGFAYSIVALLRNAPDAPPANDPIVYGAVCALMVWAAMLAMLGHARRAAHIEPLVALREE